MNLRIGRLVNLVSLAVMGLGSITYASPITIPPNLQPGDTYRLAFVTSGTRDATSSNITDYDTFVSAAATNAGLPGTWQVIGSTNAVNAFDHIGGNFSSPIYLLDGIIIATGSADLWDGTLTSPLSIDENGSQQINLVWTGTQQDGATLVSSPLGTLSPMIGLSWLADPNWIETPSSTFFEDHFHLYGISGVLTVPGSNDSSVPEPGTVSLMMLGGMALVGKVRNLRTRSARGTRPSTPAHH